MREEEKKSEKGGMERYAMCANVRDAVFALHSRRAKPLRDYRLLRVLAISRRLFGHVICESADVGWNFPTRGTDHATG